MKLNINKEMLLKNRFWVGLGVAGSVMLIGLFYLQLSVDAESDRKKLKTALDASKAATPPNQNGNTIGEREKDAKKARDMERTVWGEAYKKQHELFKWPAAVEAEFHFLDGRFASQIEITALNPKAPKDWPPESDFLTHGTFAGLVGATSFEITNKGNVRTTFSVTDRVNIHEAGQTKVILLANLPALAQGKVLTVTYQQGHYFGDPLTVSEQRTFSESYKSQILDILRTVDPLDDKDNGVVQLKDWRFKKDDADWLPDEKMTFIRYVSREWDKQNNISQEAWIAQENLWIQKEIYRCIREANDSVSVFTGKGGNVPDKVYTFKNSYFELGLSLDKKKSLTIKISNLQAKPQRLDLNFRVDMNDQGSPEIINVSGPQLEAKGHKGGKDSFTHTYDAKEAVRTGIYNRVEQVLTWETAAVKRIDHVSIGSNASDDISHSYRTYADGLKALNAAAPAAKDLKAGPGGGAAPAPKPVGPAVGGNRVKLDHGLWTDRYWEVSEQSRRVPVGVVLIVDQAFVDRVLTSFNNSKLRFLMTELLLNQYTESLQPPPVEKKVDGANPPPIAPPPAMGRPGGVPAASSGGESGVNMELVIYGIVTIYERFPPRPKTAP